MKNIGEYIVYFERLLEGVEYEEYRALRNRPDVLEKIKAFYNLCFEKMAEGLNERCSLSAGQKVNIFNEPVKLGNTQFHFNKLGKMAQEATTFEALVCLIGGYEKHGFFPEVAIIDKQVSYYPSKDELADTIYGEYFGKIRAEYDDVHFFLFPVLLVSYNEIFEYDEVTYLDDYYSDSALVNIIDYLRPVIAVMGGEVSGFDLSEAYIKLFEKELSSIRVGFEASGIDSHIRLAVINQDELSTGISELSNQEASRIIDIVTLILKNTYLETSLFMTTLELKAAERHAIWRFLKNPVFVSVTPLFAYVEASSMIVYHEDIFNKTDLALKEGLLSETYSFELIGSYFKLSRLKVRVDKMKHFQFSLSVTPLKKFKHYISRMRRTITLTQPPLS